MKYNWKNDYLALDFDGVVINSVEECLFVSYNAYAEYTHTPLVETLPQINPFIVSEFKRIRNFIRAGADFVFIIMALEQNVRITNQQDFDDFCATHQNLEKTFFDAFYKQREKLSDEQPNLWIQLNPLYEGIREFLTNFPNKDRLFIITTKKIFFVQKILSFYQIPFIESHMFNADKNRTKKSIINDLLENYKIPPQRFWFIDDQIDTLIKVQDTHVNCMLAEWGYNNTEQVLIARKHNIPTADLQKFAQIFKK